MFEELVISKFQEQLGDNYEINFGNAFDRRYTTPVSTPNGLVYDINYQAFEEKKDKIICVLTMNKAQYNAVPFLSFNTQGTIQYWYRLDDLKTDKFGVPIGDTPIDIFTDIENLRTAFSNTTISFSDTIRGKMNFSNPVKSTTYDMTGKGKMGVITVDFYLNITDNGIFGSDRVIKIGVTVGASTVYYAITGIRSYTIGNDREGASTQESGTTRPTLDGESNGNSIVFTYDNYVNSTNLAMSLIENIALGVSTTDETFSVPVQIYSGTTLKASFNALISASLLGQNGDTGLEVVQVTLQRKE